MSKGNVSKDQRIGVTEIGDPCFHLEIFDNLYRGNIIITKHLTDKLCGNLIENSDKIILHLSCTGYGGTIVEPFVPPYQNTYSQCIDMIKAGFPSSHIVLRIDPIIPTSKGIKLAMNVISQFANIGISRLRISFLDNYKHVKDRFIEKNIPLLYGGKFHEDLRIRNNVLEDVKKHANACGFKSVECCGEPNIDSIPCLSQIDIDILGLKDIELVGSSEQRDSCCCPTNKSELIRDMPHRCGHKCLYCYLKDKEPNVKDIENGNS